MGWGRISLGIAAASAGMPDAALAQIAPGSLERTIPRLSAPPQGEEPAVSEPVVQIQANARIGESFVLGAVQIEGATRYDSAELAQSFEPYLASLVDQSVLNRIAADITARYRRDGYFLSYAYVPEQAVQSGVVRLRVVEGFLGAIHVEGDAGPIQHAVRAIARKAVSNEPLRTSTLDRTLFLVGSLPGVFVNDAKLQRAEDNPARYELTFVVAPERAALFTFIDNRGTVEGARLRGYSAGNIVSLIVPGDQLQLETFAIPSDNFRFFYGRAQQSLPLGNDGLRLALSVSGGQSFQRLAETQRGRLRQFAAALTYPVVAGRDLSVLAQLSVEDWHSKERLGGVLSQKDGYQVGRLAGTLVRPAPVRVDVRLGLSRGLDGRSPDSSEPPLSRPGGNPQFIKINVDATIAAPVRDNLTVRLELAGQYSPDLLMVPEEFALGGSRIGRTFDFNAVTGDYGAGALVEFGYRPGEIGFGLQQLELFTSVDAGFATRRRSPLSAEREAWLAGAAIGTRFTLFGLHLSGEIGRTIDHHVRTGKIRAFFSGSKRF